MLKPNEKDTWYFASSLFFNVRNSCNSKCRKDIHGRAKLVRARQCLTKHLNETSSNITTSSRMDNNMIAANEIAMKKVVAMKTDDGKRCSCGKVRAMKIEDGK